MNGTGKPVNTSKRGQRTYVNLLIHEIYNVVQQEHLNMAN